MIAVKSFIPTATFDTDLQAWLASLGIPVHITIHSVTTWQLVVIAQSTEMSALAQAQITAASTIANAQQAAATVVVNGQKAAAAIPVANQALVPPLATLVADDGTVWSRGPTASILVNGQTAKGITGSTILMFNHTIFVLDLSGHWQRWSAGSATFTDVGMVQPGT